MIKSMFSPAPWNVINVSLFAGSILSGLLVSRAWSLPLSPGDRIKLSIPEGELFSGTYEVNLDGTINVPYLQPVEVAGLEPRRIEEVVAQALVDRKLFNPKFVQTTIQVVEWAPIQISITGQTYQPGRLLINERSPDARARITQSSGDYPPERFLTAAIRAAGGITPYADLKNVKLVRNSQEQTFDLTSVLNGEEFEDIPLMAGDRIVIPDAGKFQNELVRPSQITFNGIKLFLSNLTQPASSNANAGAQNASSIKYGSRLSQAVIAANCAGGSASNANRRVVLVRTDRMTGKTEYVDRQIEDLLRASTDDTKNPLLLPEDGIACYDSKSTNLKGVAETLSTIFSPFSLLLNLFR
jgi:polysaccharide biosynthesis/export protein